MCRRPPPHDQQKDTLTAIRLDGLIRTDTMSERNSTVALQSKTVADEVEIALVIKALLRQALRPIAKRQPLEFASPIPSPRWAAHPWTAFQGTAQRRP
jgi:hypothetical protein